MIVDLPVDKAFERSHRIRPGGKLLLDRLALDDLATNQVVTAHAPAISAAAWVDEPEYFPNQLNRLHIRIAAEDGFHLYVPPNPPGFTDLSVAIDAPPGVFVHEAQMPEGHQFKVEGFEEQFTVVEGEIDLSVPFYALEDTGTVDLAVSVDYQACNDSLCLPPDTVGFSMHLEEMRA